ncbi:MAG: NUDIX hydrolase [Rectinemataceae bacterium]
MVGSSSGIDAVRRRFDGWMDGAPPILPGSAAQNRMAPPHRGALDSRANYRDAAVLVLLYPRGGSLRFPLTLRSEATSTHKGQVSLPGGAREEGESLLDTALRETREEIGVDPDGVEVLGGLSALDIPHSGFHVQPFVAVAREVPRFLPEPREVAELIEAVLDELLAEDAAQLEERRVGAEPVMVPFYRLGGHKVWGATAMILAELRELLAPSFR